MAEHLHRRLTPDERQRSRAAAEAFDSDRGRIVEEGCRIFSQFDQLRDLVGVLRTRRRSLGMSLDELATRCGMEADELARLEEGTGSDWTVGTLIRFATALGADLSLGIRISEDASVAAVRETGSEAA